MDLSRDAALAAVSAEARACTRCAGGLPLGPRPTFRVAPTARVLIVGQAPGTKVHETGIPWNDASGDRLRGWLEMDRTRFYDVSRIAIVPMGLCYPGRLRNGGDAPPMPGCAELWHPRLLPLMPGLRLTLLIGGYAQSFYLGQGSMTEHVRAFRDHLPRMMPLPHPSWRTIGWAKRNPWFEAEILPPLRTAVRNVLHDKPDEPLQGSVQDGSRPPYNARTCRS